MRIKGFRRANSGKPAVRIIKKRPRRLFAVGDIHGCVDEITTLIEYLTAKKDLNSEDLLVFMGDYIDRGRSSKGVVDLCLSLKAKWPDTVFLKGNHEDMLLDFLGLGGQGGDVYLANGGQAFFASYGIEPFGPLSDIIERIPKDHLEFFKGLELAVMVAEFLFVHAGVHPDKSLEQQDAEDLLWIRKEFVQGQHQLGKTVVFGHTAFNQVFVDLPYKIGVDTGAIFGNQLSIVELVHGDFYQVDLGERAVREGHLNHLVGSGSR
jgi:serine/threonine protein phosphatase 1